MNESAPPSASSSSASSKWRYKADLDKLVVSKTFERKGWQRTENDDFHLYWANVQSVRQLFNPDSGQRLGDGQMINHFPNHYELTRKDLLNKNIKRYLKEMNRAGSNTQMPQEFVPTTYILPADYSLFVEEFRRNPNATWIMKPTGKAQGRGIFLINKIAQIKRWSTNNNNNQWTGSNGSSGGSGSQPPPPVREAYVISRYIENPLLIAGKKFDLRLYVLVTSYRPLRAYKYANGFARFCHVKYSTDVGDLENPFIHLTNVAVQKHNDDYNARHGGKWDLQNLRLFLEATWGLEATMKLFQEIDHIIIHSLKSVQHVMINDRHAFELYGYDIIIDSNLKPWLVEINASPSLTTTTASDKVLKTSLIKDTLDIIIPDDVTNPSEFRAGLHQGSRCKGMGGYIVLIDEEADKVRAAGHAGGSSAAVGAGNGGGGRATGSSYTLKGWR